MSGRHSARYESNWLATTETQKSNTGCRPLERPEFEKLRAEMPNALHPAVTFCYETVCRTGTMKKIVWKWACPRTCT
jgi:hypothetical protein